MTSFWYNATIQRAFWRMVHAPSEQGKKAEGNERKEKLITETNTLIN